MISIFTMPKACIGEFKTIQMNAIRSWKEECPNSEIIIPADEEGVADVANELGLRHIHGIRKNKFGSPLLDSLFQRAEQEAQYDTMTFINTDCMLIGNLEKAVKSIQTRFEKFLMVGMRYDSNISQSLPVENWRDFVLKNKGLLHVFARRAETGRTFVFGIDIFVFPKGLYSKVPPFNIGTFYYDGWLIYNAWQRQIPIINITSDIMTIHQKHTVKARTLGFYQEAAINRKLCSGKKAAREADFILKDGIIQRDKGLSLFTHPRNFQGEFNRLQKNAIKSWLSSCPNSEIILLGKAQENQEMAQKSPRIWLDPKKIPVNKKGTVRVKFIFYQGMGSAIHGILGYINTDLILIGDLEKLVIIAREQFREFLIVGQKWNLEVPYEIDFAIDWQSKLKAELENKGNLYSPNHVDYFIFTFQALPPGNIFTFPDFLLGRPYWENWPIFYAITNNIPVIDATNVITAIHSPHVRNKNVVDPGQYLLDKGINQNLTGNLVFSKNINESQFIFTEDSKIVKNEKKAL